MGKNVDIEVKTEIQNATVSLSSSGPYNIATIKWIPDSSDFRIRPYDVYFYIRDTVCPIQGKIIDVTKVYVKSPDSLLAIHAANHTGCGKVYFFAYNMSGTYANYEWYGDDNLHSNDSVFSHIYSTTGLKHYYLKLTGGGKTRIYHDSIYIPDTFSNVSLIDTAIVCYGDSLTIEADIQNNIPYNLNWSSGEKDTNKICLYDLKTNRRIRIELSDNSGCPDRKDSLEILIVKPFVKINRSIPKDRCMRDSFEFELLQNKADSILWQKDQSSDGMFSGDVNQTIVKYFPGTNDKNNLSFMLHITGSDTSGECKIKDSFLFKINPIPTVKIDKNKLEPLCEYEEFTIQLSENKAYKWEWERGYHSDGQFLNNPKDTIIVYLPGIRDNNLKKSVIKIMAYDSLETCSSEDSVQITILNMPYIEIDTSIQTGKCEGEAFSLMIADKDAFESQWQKSYEADGQFAGNINDTMVSYKPGNNDNLSDGFYILSRATDSSGRCVYIDSIKLMVYAIPVADFSATPQSGDIPLSVSFTNLSSISKGQINKYLWDFGDGHNSLIENPVHAYLKEDEFDVALTVSSNHECEDTLIKTQLINTIPVGVLSDPNQSFVQIYPNPGSGRIKIKSTTDELREIFVYSIEGKRISQKELHGKNALVDLSYLEKGIYFIKIWTMAESCYHFNLSIQY